MCIYDIDRFEHDRVDKFVVNSPIDFWTYRHTLGKFSDHGFCANYLERITKSEVPVVTVKSCISLHAVLYVR